MTTAICVLVTQPKFPRPLVPRINGADDMHDDGKHMRLCDVKWQVVLFCV